LKRFGEPWRNRTSNLLIEGRGRGEKLRPFYFIQSLPKPLRVNELAEFQESKEFHDVGLSSVKFGEITDIKTDTVNSHPSRSSRGPLPEL